MPEWEHYLKYDAIAQQLSQRLLTDMEAAILWECADHFNIGQSEYRDELVRLIYKAYNEDNALNTIPLKLWDRLAMRWSIGNKYTLAEKVYLLKHITRHHILHIAAPKNETQPA